MAADLLRRGWEVFRAVSPACSCDLIIHRAGVLLRVEVRTMNYYAKGDRWYVSAGSDPSRYDVLASWNPATEQPTYAPTLLTWDMEAPHAATSA